MRRNRRLRGLALALVTLVAVLLPVPAGAAASATISGTVSGSGFARTDLWVGTWTDDDELTSAHVAADGSYSLTGLDAYHPDVDPAHPSSFHLVLYVGNPDPDAETGSAQHADEIGWVGVRAGRTTTRDVAFTKVVGSVTSAGSGSPLASTSVTIRSTGARHVSSGFTDASGTYAALVVLDDADTTWTAFFDPLDDNVARYFGDSADRDHATRFSLDPTAETTIDIALPVAAHVAGVLRLAKGGTYVDGTVVLYRTTTPTTSAPDYRAPGIVYPPYSSFEIGGIEPGTYRIAFGRARGRALAPGHFYDATPEASVRASTVVTLTAGTTTRLRTQYASPRLAGRISGRIVRTVGGRRVGRHGLEVEARPLDTRVSARTAMTNRHGYFVIPGLAPGSYRVHVWNSSYPRPGAAGCTEKQVATARVTRLHTTRIGSHRFTAPFRKYCAEGGNAR